MSESIAGIACRSDDQVNRVAAALLLDRSEFLQK